MSALLSPRSTRAPCHQRSQAEVAGDTSANSQHLVLADEVFADPGAVAAALCGGAQSLVLTASWPHVHVSPAHIIEPAV